ncbi:MAG: hypothetical protein V4628_06855 [Pseudomonadota bacterium]
MIPQSAFTICAVVEPTHLGELRALLARMNILHGMADPDNSLVPFGQIHTLHFARFVIVESLTNDDILVHGEVPKPWAPMLVFMGDCDGPRDVVLAELAVRAKPGLEKIFSCCQGFAGTSDTLLEWMQARNVVPAASYVNWLGRTVAQVHEELALHRLLRQQLVKMQQSPVSDDPAVIHRHLQTVVKEAVANGQLTLSPIPKTPFGWRIKNLLEFILVPLVLILLAPLFLVLAPFYLFVLRRKEKADPEILLRPDPQWAAQLAALEDHMVTNQFSAFGDVKPGAFRRYTIIAVLFLLNFAARHLFNKGYLTRVQTIHFAHWIFLDDKRRVLFFSNYDGSHEAYMDDFINKVAWGLNLVFSNGVGYPASRWLVKGGAEYEGKFKRHLRRHQLCTDVWYKAYPDATATELARNIKIRKGLETPVFREDSEIRDWLSLI